MTPRVLYLSHGPESLYERMRSLAGPAIEMLTLETHSDAERFRLLPEADAVIVAAYPLTREMIEAAGSLRFVHHQGVGYHDTIDLPSLARRGARLALTPAGTTTGVAEHSVLLTLAVMRRLAFADSELRRGQWHVNALRPESRELAGKTIGYVGMGRIGQAAARRFAAFDTMGVYFDPQDTLDSALQTSLGLAKVEFEALLEQADVVTLHLPLTPATRHLIDAAALARMKLGTIVINTARGPLIDEAALIAGLESGAIGGAGLDVFETEPLARSSPLLTMRNTVLTPHISAGTIDAFETKMRSLFENLHRFFDGKPLENEVKLPPPC